MTSCDLEMLGPKMQEKKLPGGMYKKAKKNAARHKITEQKPLDYIIVLRRTVIFLTRN